MNNFYVLPYKGVWGISRENTDEIVSIHDTKEEAIETAKNEIKNKDDAKLIVLQADGTIENLGEEPLDSMI